jgi:hypothetical protein
MEFINDIQITSELMRIIEIIIPSVSDKILVSLQKHIREETYRENTPYFPNKYYLMGMGIPSFEFLDAWKWNSLPKSINSITRELAYNYLGMTYDPENFWHGDRENDRREELAEDLNVTGTALNSNFPGKPRLPYWSNFLWEMMEEDQVGKWFDEELFKFGFIRT